MTDDLKHVPVDGSQAEAAVQRPPLLVSPVSNAPTSPAGTRSLSLAFLAGAVVALLGGLVWAGVAIGTGYDIGFLALFVGAATGFAVQLAAGGPVGSFERGLAGALAASSIIVGKYVIFVHEVRAAFGTLLSQRGVPVGYLAGHQINFFVHNFGTIVRPIYWLWILFAFVAAVRTSGGRAVLGFGRARS